MSIKLTKKALLIILDGFGIRAESKYNAIKNAHMPNYDNYVKQYALGQIDASGVAVGLPVGQFGNSEVGHLNIGAGRVVRQDISKIDYAIETKGFFSNRAFVTAIEKTTSGNLHIMGLLSDGGVHAHIAHIFALIKLASQASQITQIWLHVFLDGRDTPPQSALLFIKQLQDYLTNYPKVKIATCSGRYYAMDRDKRYDRIKLAYDAITDAISPEKIYTDLVSIVDVAYAGGINDEFVKPTVLQGYTGVKAGDSMIFANFRSDRAIQLTDALVNPEFKEFKCRDLQLGAFVTMTRYEPRFAVTVAFPHEAISNTLGEYLSTLGLKQLRIAETEKYPHITYFLNGGCKTPSINEDWVLVNSPREVATYDQKPQMSLPEVTDKLVAAILSDKYDVIVTNFANGDMVGHTGSYAAAIKAVESLDAALGIVVPLMLKHGGEVLIIADHGNCEEMFDLKSNQPHTQHTTNLVPCLYIGRKASICTGGALKDVAPTLLKICGLDKPKEMTGTSLIQFKDL